MHILLIGFGSRGDVQPLLALGCGLQDAGYRVSIASSLNFRALIEDAGLTFAPIRTDMQALMTGEHGQQWIESGNNYLKQAQSMRRMIAEAGEAVGQDLLNAAHDADVLVSGLSSFGVADAIAQKFNKQHVTVLLAPMNPTRFHAATMQPSIPRKNIALNRFAGYVGQYFTHWIFKPVTDQFRASLGLESLRFGGFARAYNQRVPVLYGLSPLVMPRAEDWGAHIHVTGYWFYDAPNDWQPSDDLSRFLQAGEPPVYIGFGSMSATDPEGTAHMMLEALQQSGQRGIIHSGWANFTADQLPDTVYLLDYAPHDWLFPQMAAVIHHGGAGTTAAALRAGVPNSVVAHMADQPYWGRRVHELGVGAPYVQRTKLNPQRLATMIRETVSDAGMRERAASLGQQIRQENGVERAVDILGTIVKSGPVAASRPESTR